MHDERQPNEARRFWAGRFEEDRQLERQLVDEQFPSLKDRGPFGCAFSRSLKR